MTNDELDFAEYLRTRLYFMECKSQAERGEVHPELVDYYRNMNIRLCEIRPVREMVKDK